MDEAPERIKYICGSIPGSLQEFTRYLVLLRLCGRWPSPRTDGYRRGFEPTDVIPQSPPPSCIQRKYLFAVTREEHIDLPGALTSCLRHSIG